MVKHIGKMLKAARLKLGLKAAEVGAACNLTRSRIYGFEASNFILPKQLPGLAKALRIPLEQLQAENGPDRRKNKKGRSEGTRELSPSVRVRSALRRQPTIRL